MLRYIFRLRDVRRGKGDCDKIRQRNGPFFVHNRQINQGVYKQKTNC